jgi:hypothetical protein
VKPSEAGGKRKQDGQLVDTPMPAIFCFSSRTTAVNPFRLHESISKKIALQEDVGARCLARTKAPEGGRSPRRWREWQWLA